MEFEVVQGDDVCVHDLCRVVFGDRGAVHDDRAFRFVSFHSILFLVLVYLLHSSIAAVGLHSMFDVPRSAPFWTFQCLFILGMFERAANFVSSRPASAVCVPVGVSLPLCRS